MVHFWGDTTGDNTRLWATLLSLHVVYQTSENKMSSIHIRFFILDLISSKGYIRLECISKMYIPFFPSKIYRFLQHIHSI